ncbi:MAG: response regulator transcription factor [Turicibacter sp.]|nr:response regulator transcription factor [Turicibacter sp.]
MAKILIVEDDNHIHSLLLEILTQEGYEVQGAYSGTEALLYINQNDYDLVLLDLMLPGKSGMEVLTEMHEKKAIPTIVLTAIDNKESTIELLRAGASDYLTKPFNTGELLVRIEVQLRQQEASYAKSTLVFKNVLLDLHQFEGFIGDHPLSLSKREFAILKCLMENPKRVYTKNNLYQQVWGDEFYGDENTINVHISKIRSKIAKLDPNNEYIQTVWGIGFKMVE